MARSGDVTLKNTRKVRRDLNARLAKAKKAGRLAEEIGAIEREAMHWWKQGETKAKPRRRAAP